MNKFPCYVEVKKIITELRNLMFPNYFCQNQDEEAVKERLLKQLEIAFKDEVKAKEVVDTFFSRLDEISHKIYLDALASFDGDPAASSMEEVILCYPGMFAMLVHRIAHELYLLEVPLIPRMMSEYAHSKVAIDISPGATIGESFFIDHGTGVVIGETCIIGDNVKIYQGVTLGALSTRGGQKLQGKKRHPSIGNNVTIYANATVLGGDTFIGDNSVIGGNTFITASVEANSKVLK